MRALALTLALLVSPCAWAGPAEDAAWDLFEGKLTPDEAAAIWRQAKLDPDDAVRMLRELPLEAPPAGDHVAALTDGYGRETDAQVRLPSDGPDEHERYRVAVVLHGIGGNSEQGLEVAQLLLPPHTIVIAPSAQKLDEADQPEDLRLAKLANIPVLKNFEHWWSYRQRCFAIAALDYLKRHYALDTNRVLLVGYSMGGFGTWNVGLRYHHLFAGLAPMAGGIAREEFALGEDDWYRFLQGNARNVPIFFIHGDEDEVVPVRFDRWSKQRLERLGAEHVYHEIEGGKHVLSEQLTPDSPVITELVAWLGARVRDPHPETIEHRALGAYHGDAYWLRIEALRGDQARVVAEVHSGNRLELQATGVEKLRIYLDPERFKVGSRGAKLKLLLNGVARAEKLRPSLEVVAESWARAHDPELLYTCALTLDVPRGEGEGSGGGGLSLDELKKLRDAWTGDKKKN